MPWNYRVFKQDSKVLKGVEFAPAFFIGEQYYSDEGDMHTDIHDNQLIGESVDDLKEVMQMMQEAFNQPVIELDAEGNYKESNE